MPLFTVMEKPTKNRARRGVVVKASSVGEWLRGPAHVQGKWLVLDGKRATPYRFEDEPRAGRALAKVKTQEHAIAFVRQFGLLRQGIVQSDGTFEPVVGALPLTRDTDTEWREPLADVLETGEILRDIYRAALLARSAKEEPDKLSQLRRRYGGLSTSHKDDDQFLAQVSQWAVARRLSDLLAEARPWLEYRAAGRFHFTMRTGDLLGFCYWRATQDLVDQERIAQCPECQEIYQMEDGHQVFCTPRCASRARQRRHRERHSA